MQYNLPFNCMTKFPFIKFFLHIHPFSSANLQNNRRHHDYARSRHIDHLEHTLSTDALADFADLKIGLMIFIFWGDRAGHEFSQETSLTVIIVPEGYSTKPRDKGNEDKKFSFGN